MVSEPVSVRDQIEVSLSRVSCSEQWSPALVSVVVGAGSLVIDAGSATHSGAQTGSELVNIVASDRIETASSIGACHILSHSNSQCNSHLCCCVNGCVFSVSEDKSREREVSSKANSVGESQGDLAG